MVFLRSDSRRCNERRRKRRQLGCRHFRTRPNSLYQFRRELELTAMVAMVIHALHDCREILYCVRPIFRR